MDYAKRRDRVLAQLRRAKLDALLVTDEVNVRYLTGFTGDSSYLLLARSAQIILSDARYEEQLQQECPEVDAIIRRPPTTLAQIVSRAVQQAHVQKLGLEGDSVSWAQHEQFAHQLPRVALTSTQGWIEQLRAIKDRQEVMA